MPSPEHIRCNPGWPELGVIAAYPLVPVRADRHPALVYLATLGPRSRRPQRHALDVVARLLNPGANAEELPWHELRYQHAAAVRSALADRYAPATANRILSAMRAVLREAWRLGLMTAEDYRRASDVEKVRGHRLPAGRELTAGELCRLFSDCAKDRNQSRGARDAAVLGLAYGAGLRREEIAGLCVEAYDAAARTVRVLGKGDRERLAHLAAGGADAVSAWLQRRGSSAGPLVCPISQRGDLEPRHMTSQSIYDLIRRRAARAGISKCSPHDLRRTYIGDMLDAGADLSAVQQLVGHTSPTTTARYDRRGERAKARAAGLLHVPFVAP